MSKVGRKGLECDVDSAGETMGKQKTMAKAK